MMINPTASAVTNSTQASDAHQNTISALNQFGVELRRAMHPGNKPEGLGTVGAASACYAYDMGALYARDRESFQFSKEQAWSESTLFQGGLALKYGGGNCDHYSALGEFFLSRVIKPKLESQGLAKIDKFERMSDLNAKHSFLAVWVNGGSEPIIFDPWAAKSADKALAGYASQYQFDVAGGRSEGAIAIEKWGAQDLFPTGDIDAVANHLSAFVNECEARLQSSYPQDYQAIKQRAESGNVAFAAYGNDTGFTPEMNAYAAELYSREGSFVSAWYREQTAPPPLARTDSDQSMNSTKSASDMSICND